MNYDSHSLSTLFEKSLIRITADFESDKDTRSVVSELSSFLKTKITKEDASSYNFQLRRTEDGVYHLSTSFLMYRDSRLTIINLLKWIERNGFTDRNHNLFIDLKFLDAQKGPFKGTLFSNSLRVESVDKLKFILDFDEDSIYKDFPTRKDSFNSQSILIFEMPQKFIPRESDIIDPKYYTVPSTKNCGINFDTIIDGYLRMQYLGGQGYEKKVQEILKAINQFCVTAWIAATDKKMTAKNIEKFKIVLDSKRKIRESYYDYSVFKKNYPNIKFSVDLMDNSKVLDYYYQILRDRIFDIFSNIEFKGSIDLNYDTTISVFQIKESSITVKELSGVEIIKCKITKGTFTNCDIYDCGVVDASFYNCNLFLDTIAERCNLYDSFVNRTVEIKQCQFTGMNGILNGSMLGGVFITGKVGLFANISPETKVIQYQPLKSGYFVAGDQIIIPTKKFKQL
jgi:hypothetical protein